MGSVLVSALLKVTYSCIGDERMRKEAGEGARLAGIVGKTFRKSRKTPCIILKVWYDCSSHQNDVSKEGEKKVLKKTIFLLTL